MHGHNNKMLSSAKKKRKLNWSDTFMELVFYQSRIHFKAIKNKNFLMWPGLDANIVTKIFLHM